MELFSEAIAPDRGIDAAAAAILVPRKYRREMFLFSIAVVLRFSEATKYTKLG
jgi:hypothetical protein